RSGEGAEGAKELKAELKELGAEARIASCDVSDRSQLKQLIDSISAEHPLGMVIHSAVVPDDGTLESLDPQRLDHVFAPKVDAATPLPELTKELELSHSILFSSAAGILGGAGQASYAAANVFCDALAAKRRAQGLPATSLAWGLWLEVLSKGAFKEAGQELIDRCAEQARTRLGFAPMPSEQGLDLFDLALQSEEALLAPVPFDRAALRSQAEQGTLQALLSELIPSAPRAAQGDSS